MVEPISEQQIPVQHNVHVVLTEPGCIRGNHYHQQGTEITVILGPALVRIREGGTVRDIRVPDGDAFRFTIPPLVSHAVQNVGQRPMLLMAFNTFPHDPSHPDVRRDVLIEP